MGVILTVNLLKAKLLKLTHGIFIVERIGVILAIFFTGNTAIFFCIDQLYPVGYKTGWFINNY